MGLERYLGELGKLYGVNITERKSAFLTKEEQARLDQIALHRQVAGQMAAGGGEDQPLKRKPRTQKKKKGKKVQK